MRVLVTGVSGFVGGHLAEHLIESGDLIVGLEVSHLREVERWVLSWGAECIAVEPAELKERVARSLAEAASRYMMTAGLSGRPTIAPSANPDSPTEVTACL